MRVLNCIKDYHKNKINNESNKHFSDLKYIYIPGNFFLFLMAHHWNDLADLVFTLLFSRYGHVGHPTLPLRTLSCFVCMATLLTKNNNTNAYSGQPLWSRPNPVIQPLLTADEACELNTNLAKALMALKWAEMQRWLSQLFHQEHKPFLSYLDKWIKAWIYTIQCCIDWYKLYNMIMSHE